MNTNMVYDSIYGMGVLSAILCALIALIFTIFLSLAISGLVGNIITLNNSSKELNQQSDALQKKAIIGLFCCSGGLIVSFIPYLGWLGKIAIIVGLVFAVKGMKMDAYKRTISLYFLFPTVISIVIFLIVFLLTILSYIFYVDNIPTDYTINNSPSSYESQYDTDYSYPYETQYYYQY